MCDHPLKFFKHYTLSNIIIAHTSNSEMLLTCFIDARKKAVLRIFKVLKIDINDYQFACITTY